MFFNLLSMGGVTYDADYQAYLDYLTTNSLSHPSTAKKTVENAFMIAVKAAFSQSTIAACPILQMLMFKTDAASGASLVNWVNPGTYNATNSGATFTSDTGWNSSGTPNYIISGLATADINQSDFTVLIRAYTNSQLNLVITGVGDGAVAAAESLTLVPRSTTNDAVFRFISDVSTSTTVSNLDATNRIAFGRTDASNAHYSINGVSFTNVSRSVNAIDVSKDITILAHNGSSVSSYFTGGVSYRIVTSRKLTDAEVAAVDTALVNYLA
jgi:hypothetical protein